MGIAYHITNPTIGWEKIVSEEELEDYFPEIQSHELEIVEVIEVDNEK